MTPDVDVVIVGAGLSGIGAAVHLRRRCPELTVTVLEGRAAIGGTWDLFRYPGVRSDSDMYTLGYEFKPWTGRHAIAAGGAILDYLREAADEEDVTRRIRFRHKVIRADWSSEDQAWTVTAERAGEDAGEGAASTRVTLTARFLYCCTGYYDPDRGYTPDFPGSADFTGPVVHPQSWPQDLEYAGRAVAVIGSGATAVGLVPALAEKAARVTMIQRSPSYVLSAAREDPVRTFLSRILPAKAAHGLTRWWHILTSIGFFQLSRRSPAATKRILRDRVRKALPEGYPVDTHFRPAYNPWDQRLCLVPDGDLFAAIRAGRAELVTDTIERFTPTGIRLTSGREVPADIIVTATGLTLVPCGRVTLTVDGETLDPARLVSFKGIMLCGVPNFALAAGYTNASWTLKVDLTARYVCRLLEYMRRQGFASVTPIPPPPDEVTRAMIDLSSGYVTRSAQILPRQGSREPWRLHQNYLTDRALFGANASIVDGLRFRRAARPDRVLQGVR